jgi:hypothetical protein
VERPRFLTDEGIEKSLNDLWGKNFPSVVNRFVSMMSLAENARTANIVVELFAHEFSDLRKETGENGRDI